MPSQVFVMMSGGVDSSVAAARLVQQGYAVRGIFMRCWSLQMLQSMGLSDDLYGCSWEDDLQDASLVAKTLQIPFETWNFEQEYKQQIVDYMLRSYQQGLTPNPDVMCNGAIKFGLFYQQAMALGADYVATGHYASVWQGQQIWRSLDRSKDQSYFLWQIRPAQIPHILFPIGEFASKNQVRAMAARLGLGTADKPDSQGLCFIGHTPLREMLLQTFGRQPGPIVDIQTGQTLGQHPGAFLYTIGQRQKLGLSGGPWFVSKIDVPANIVYVTHGQRDTALYTTEILCQQTNWLVTPSCQTFECEAQIRYRQTAQKCRVQILPEASAAVKFAQPVRAAAAGQSIVFYKGRVLLGGGVIAQ